MSKKILVIEDDSVLQKALYETLISAGYEVFLASNGKEGIDRAKMISLDLVLLDIILPILDGFQVLGMIRSCRKLAVRNLPVIILSNLGQEEDNKKAMDMGANDYIVKVYFTTDEVIKKIKLILGE